MKSHVELNFKENELLVNEVLSNDDFLRKIFYVGYNYKALTKTFAKSIVFEREAKKIVQLIESKELSIRSCGPLLLGLMRVYDRIVRNFLEDLNNIFNEQSNERKSKKAIISREFGIEETNEEIDKKESEDLEKRNKEKKTNDNIMTKYLLTSPYKQGIYSLLADQTPSKFLANLSSDKREQSSIEAFRPDMTSSDSKFMGKETEIKIKENKNVKYISEASIFDENQEGDFNNFFQIISANQRKEGDLIRDLLESETRINFKEELNDFGQIDLNINLDEKKFDEEEIKFSHDFEEKLKEYRSKAKKIRSNFTYDEAISFDMDSMLKLHEEKNNLNEDHVDLYKRMKIMIIHDKFDFERDLEKFYQEKSSITKFTDDKKFSEKLRDTSSLFNNLNEEFQNDFLKTKEKILEQITVKKEELIPENNEDVMIEDQNNDLAQISSLDNDKNQEINTNYISINKETKIILENAKKYIKLEDLANQIIVKNQGFSFADVFYNTLCMAQNKEILIKQTEFFNNSLISLKIVK